ncbi:hypothetical protein E2C01_048021 [Portunus trituberculatus]|uniref:Uncharacterized protein n=1 Tax=Portunus trituberculatus TaxID=210409 RepID=A0A5B7GC43_PORTR|nr:hypothetical protein [Portunus trituberculatus]
MRPSTEEKTAERKRRKRKRNFNPFSTRTRFHIHCGYYLAILYSFRNLCGGLK